MNLGAIFFTGLVAGGLSCLAVQGGLLATLIAQSEELNLRAKTKSTGNLLPITLFLLAKLTAYTILGALLGLLGSAAQISSQTQIIIYILVAIFMIGTALDLLKVHPIFRYFIIEPPRFLTRLIHNQSKNTNFFSPLLLGAFTVFIPCGATQAIMALAIASGNPISGALTLFVFTLGTSPLFFILGFIATKINKTLHQQFLKFSAIVIILLAIFNLDNAIALTGSNFTLEKILKGTFCTLSYCKEDYLPSSLTTPLKNIIINIDNNGYTPHQFAIKAGEDVSITLFNKDSTNCAQAFTIPSLNIHKIITPGNTTKFTITAPETPGTQISFMCSMGMYRGTIHII